MAAIKASSLLLLLFTVILLVDGGSGNEPPAPCPSAQRGMNSPPLQPRQGGRRGERVEEGRGRKMIGSTAPVCTYNECRGCKYRCTAQQVPVEGNDPFNSPYHYRCLCHRS